MAVDEEGSEQQRLHIRSYHQVRKKCLNIFCMLTLELEVWFQGC